jgi:hypothetical protein
MKHVLSIMVLFAVCCPSVVSGCGPKRAAPPECLDCLDPAHDGMRCCLPEGGYGKCLKTQCLPTVAP